MDEFSVCAVLPAGGKGERMASEIPKQYCEIGGKPLFLHTVEAFESAFWIQKIVLVVCRDQRAYVEALLQEHGHERTVVVEGGTTRHRSIKKGVDALYYNINGITGSGPPDIVLIHDVVRPFVKESTMLSVARAAKLHGAAGAVVPLVSTVICANKTGFLDYSLDRARYRSSEMPQAFRLDVIHTAYQKAEWNDMEHGSECLHLAKTHANTIPKLVESDCDLWKVTYPRDIYSAEGIIKRRQTTTAVISKEEGKFITGVVKHLKTDLKLVDIFKEEASVPESYHSIICTSEKSDIFDKLTSCYYHSHSGLMLVHLCILEQELTTVEIASLVETTRKVSKKMESSTIVNALICHRSTAVKQVAQILSRLVTDRRKEYSGQTFFC